MKHVSETIIVEGKYDLNKLKQCVDAHIVETSGFGVFNDKEKKKLIRMLAVKNGIIILTDSDSAGFVIRNYIRGIVKNGVVKHAYIPEIEGKERRKSAPSKEGMLGVEGMTPEVIENALSAAGATFDGKAREASAELTKSDMYLLGLSGGENSAKIRNKLSEKLGLPHLITANAFLSAVNMLCTRKELEDALEDIKRNKACSF